MNEQQFSLFKCKSVDGCSAESTRDAHQRDTFKPSDTTGPHRPGGGCSQIENGLAETRRRSLVPRLPHSGMRTLKLCRCGEPGIFCHVKSAKDRREVDATLIVRGRMRLRTEKGTKVADNLLHISSYRGLNNIHTER